MDECDGSDRITLTVIVTRRLAVDDAQLIDRWKQIQTANPLAAVVLITTLSLYCQTIVHNTRSQSVYSLTLAAQVQPVQDSRHLGSPAPRIPGQNSDHVS
ncbi:hypothetical protein RRG08_024913 [Elysia crispata]|uniref:Uncharacterized protein n=1 Tax=Elysia crispata TaxID=231223 RepID=A0AAE0ZZM9_9GAST|nr:hypothetical protein RRG08_024913 [Elysia crispata]